MPLTEQQYKDLIIAQIGDTASGVLADNIDLLWTKYDTIADLDLRSLYVQLDAIDLVIPYARSQVSFRALDGASVNLSDMMGHLLTMRDLVVAKLTQAVGSTYGAGGTIGELTTKAPIEADRARSVDPNDRIYRGDPLRWRGRLL